MGKLINDKNTLSVIWVDKDGVSRGRCINISYNNTVKFSNPKGGYYTDREITIKIVKEFFDNVIKDLTDRI